MTFREIIAWIVVGILLLFGGYMTYKSASANGKVKTLTTELTACQNSPKTTDTINVVSDTIRINKTVILPVYHTDTVLINSKPEITNTYKDTLRTKDFDLAYGAKTIGTLKEITFPYYKLHLKEIITYTTIDTCLPHALQPKSLWDWEVTPRVAYYPFDNSFGVVGEAVVSYWNIAGIIELGMTTKKQVEFNIGLGYKFHK